MAMSNTPEEDATKSGGFHAVSPKKDCPHVQSLVSSIVSLYVDMSKACGICQNVGENWLCLTCSEVFCSRYVNGHMVDHNKEQQSHMIALSFSDLSFWCYQCDSYIESHHLQSILQAATTAKFDPPQKLSTKEPKSDSAKQPKGSPTEEPKPSLVKQPEGSPTEEPKSDLVKQPECSPSATQMPPSSTTNDEQQKTVFHLESCLPKEVLLSRMRATIYGNCIGDAIGLLTEFMTKEEAQQIYGPPKKTFFGRKTSKLELHYGLKQNDFHRSRWEVGDWTDDSDQMILILRTLLGHNGKANILDFVQKLKVWTESGYEELGDDGGMGLGQTTFKVISKKDFLTDPHKCARQVWVNSGKWVAPNGAVMRTSVLGIQDFSDISTVINNTKQICQVTHADPRCIASCIAVTTAIALMLQGKYCEGRDWSYNVMEICEVAYNYACKELETPEQKEELRKHMFADSLDELGLAEGRSIGYTYKCLGAGFWAFRQDDFQKALTGLVMEAGDADTNGAVAGALLGCKLGVERLPIRWLEDLLHKKWLDDQIDRYISMLGI